MAPDAELRQGNRGAAACVAAAIALALLIAALLPAAAGADVLEAEAVLPPGESGFVSIAGVASGTGSPHLTDQTNLFTHFELRPFGFDQPGESESPKAGVTITRDAYGVPVSYNTSPSPRD